MTSTPVDEELHAELRQLFAELKHEVEARAVVLTGHGRAFSSARYSAT
jgi:enoyl-CoA hydratase/carnithine racemase